MDELRAAAEAFLEEARKQSERYYPDLPYRGQSYAELPYPVELDACIQRLVQCYCKSNETDRAAVRALIDEHHYRGDRESGWLCQFVKRAAALAVREGSARPIVEGLIAFGMLDRPGDPIEVDNTSYAVDAAIRIGADVIALFIEAKEFASPTVSEWLDYRMKQYQLHRQSHVPSYRIYYDKEGKFRYG